VVFLVARVITLGVSRDMVCEIEGSIACTSLLDMARALALCCISGAGGEVVYSK